MIANRVIGGNGGETASIFVTGLSATDTVTAVNPSGGIISASWNGTAWVFSELKEYGTYTITATDGTNTATQDVLVDVATQYDVEIALSRKLYLYNLGDECEDVTGGWHLFWNYDNTATFKKNADHLYLSAQRSPGVGGEGAMGTNNKISLNGFSELHYVFTQNSNTLNKLYYSTKQTSDKSNSYGFSDYCTEMSSAISGEHTSEEVTVQLSDYQDVNNYLGFRMSWYTGSGLVELKIHKVWLE